MTHLALRTLILAVILALGLGVASAAPLYSFTVLPMAGILTGLAGSTLGWGYAITNDSDDYMVTTALNADLFAHALPRVLFDFPVVAPHGTAARQFVVDNAGLFQLTWEQSAPPGTINAGLFALSVDYYSGDPLAGGAYLFTADDAYAAYAATVGARAVPAPATLPLMVLGLGLLAWGNRTRPSMTVGSAVTSTSR